MDFRVTVTEKKDEAFKEYATFEQFADVLNYICSQMAQWNNFNSGQTLVFEIDKVPSGTETLGVSVDDEFKVNDLFGGQ